MSARLPVFLLLLLFYGVCSSAKEQVLDENGSSAKDIEGEAEEIKQKFFNELAANIRLFFIFLLIGLAAALNIIRISIVMYTLFHKKQKSVKLASVNTEMDVYSPFSDGCSQTVDIACP